MKPLHFFYLILLFSFSAIAQGEKDLTTVSLTPVKKALVIGNQRYVHSTPLSHIDFDANDMKIALEKLGFKVTMVQDVDLKSMNKAIAAFTAQILPNEIALFYYSGHGLGYHGKNYLLPVNANPLYFTDLDKQAIILDSVLLGFEQRKASLKLAFVDACRSLPKLKSNTGKDQTDDSPDDLFGGFVKPTYTPRGTFIAFATQEGKRAFERVQDRNSLFTNELLRFLTNPNLSIRTILDSTTICVEAQSQKRQIPSRYDELRGDFWFLGKVNKTEQQVVMPKPEPVSNGTKLLDDNPCANDLTKKCESTKDFFVDKQYGIGLTKSTAKRSAVFNTMAAIGQLKSATIKSIAGNYLNQKMMGGTPEEKEKLIELITIFFETNMVGFEILCERMTEKRENNQTIYECTICGKAPKAVQMTNKEMKTKLKNEILPKGLDADDLLKYLFRELEKK